MSVSLQRLASNQVLFREVNERLREVVDEAAGASDFICECSNEDCTEFVTLEFAEYERVRARPNRFVIAPEHEIPEIDHVVWKSDRYFLVEKTEGADYATETDPRTREG